MFSRRLMAVTTASAVATMTNRKTTVALALPECLPNPLHALSFTLTLSVPFATHGDQTLAQLVDVLDYAVVYTLQCCMPCFVHYFRFRLCKNYLKSVKI